MPSIPPPPRYDYNPRQGQTMLDLIMQRGNNAAEGAARSGAIWGNAFNTIGQTLAGGFQRYGEQKKEDEDRNVLKAQDQAFMGLVSSGKPLDPRSILRIYGPQRGMEIAKGFSAFHEMETKSGEEAAKLLPGLVGGMDNLSEPLRAQFYPTVRARALASGLVAPDALPEQYTPETWQAISQYVRGATAKPGEAFTLSPGQVRIGPDGQPVAQVPPNPPAPPQPRVVGRDLVDPATGRVIHRAPAEPRAPRDERLVQIAGPNGTAVWVREAEAVGRPAAQAARSVTGQERTALGFYNRANQAAEDIAPIEEKIAEAGLGSQLQLQSNINLLQTSEQQSYRQAQRAFTEARLRKESGAAIPVNEYENDARTYFAQPGDSKETMEQKREARAVVLDGLRFGAGKAYEEYYGQPTPTARTRGAAPSPPGAQSGAPVRVNTPAEAARLPRGTQFQTPDGQIRVVP